MAVLFAVIAVVVSYLIGSLSSAVLISKTLFKKDIREQGSGNAGATNMLRVHGKKMGVITLLIDVLKGVVSVLVAVLLRSLAVKTGVDENAEILRAYAPLAAFFAAVGHDFPVFFGFRGGKGVATSLGAVITLNPLLGLVVMVVSVGIMAVTKIVSVGSMAGAVLFFIGTVVLAVVKGGYTIAEIVLIGGIAVLLIIRHHENIKRLINGTENKLGAKKN